MLRQIAGDPDNLDLRRRYAQSVRKDSPNRAEFIEIQLWLATAQVERGDLEYLERFWRESELKRLHGEEWTPPSLKALGVTGVRYNRGFVELVRISARDFLDHAEDLFAEAPIAHLDLTGVKPDAGELFASPHLIRVRSLEMVRNDLEDREIEILAAAPLENLRWLSVGGNRIGRAGVESLARATRSGRIPLEFVSLAGNPFNPIEDLVYDMGAIIDAELPPEGEELERGGPLPWLHRRVKKGLIQPVDRFDPSRTV